MTYEDVMYSAFTDEFLKIAELDKEAIDPFKVIQGGRALAQRGMERLGAGGGSSLRKAIEQSKKVKVPARGHRGPLTLSTESAAQRQMSPEMLAQVQSFAQGGGGGAARARDIIRRAAA